MNIATAYLYNINSDWNKESKQFSYKIFLINLLETLQDSLLTLLYYSSSLLVSRKQCWQHIKWRKKLYLESNKTTVPLRIIFPRVIIRRADSSREKSRSRQTISSFMPRRHKLNKISSFWSSMPTLERVFIIYLVCSFLWTKECLWKREAQPSIVKVINRVVIKKKLSVEGSKI